MRYVRRELERQVRKAAKGFPTTVLIPGRGGSLRLVECKAGRTVMPAMAAPMQRLAEAAQKKRAKGTRVDMFLVHQGAATGGRIQAVAPGVQGFAMA